MVVFQHGECYDSLIGHINRKKQENNEQENSIGQGFARFAQVRRLLNVADVIGRYAPAPICSVRGWYDILTCMIETVRISLQ